MTYSFNFEDGPFIIVDVVASGMGPAVVPVIFRRNRDDSTMRSQGTAFCLASFDSGEALFATAGHVVAELDGSQETIEPFLLLPDASDPFNLVGVRIKQVALAETHSDVALLVVRPAEADVRVAEPMALKLTFAPPRIGGDTMALGYALAPAAQAVGKRVSYAMRAARGEVRELHESRRGGMVDFPSFETTALYEHAMSGGPIIDTDGLVVGLISTGYETSDGKGPIGYGACTGAMAELRADLTTDRGVVDEFTVARLADMGLLGPGGVELRLERGESGVLLTWPDRSQRGE